MFKVLTVDDYDLYMSHVKKNMKNYRVYDKLILDKINHALDFDPRIIIFAELNNGNIVRSVMTIKKVIILEYLIINIRSSTNYFSKTKFLELFDFIFSYYEKLKYYKWMLARPSDLLNPTAFNGLYLSYPFSKYETAIESYSGIENFKGSYYETELLSKIPDNLPKNKFLIISGFCKQIHREFDSNITSWCV